MIIIFRVLATIILLPTASLPTATDWEREDADMPITATQRGSRLVFRRLRLTDAGTYTCNAKNSLGEAKLYVNLVIQGAPRESSTLWYFPSYEITHIFCDTFKVPGSPLVSQALKSQPQTNKQYALSNIFGIDTVAAKLLGCDAASDMFCYKPADAVRHYRGKLHNNEGNCGTAPAWGRPTLLAACTHVFGDQVVTVLL